MLIDALRATSFEVVTEPHIHVHHVLTYHVLKLKLNANSNFQTKSLSSTATTLCFFQS